MSKRTITVILDDENGTASIHQENAKIKVYLDGLDFDPKKLGKVLGQYILEVNKSNESK